MYKLELKHEFDSAHKLENYKGACANLHGHTYKFIVSLKSKVLQNDMIMDFKEVKKIVKENIDIVFDHKYINDEVDYNPTAENMVKDIYFRLKKKIPLINSVKLWEGTNSSIEYNEDEMDELNFESYISGFVDGEGYFCIREKELETFEAWFGIILREDDYEILEKIQKYFNCGILGRKQGLNKKDGIPRSPQARFEVRKYKDLYEKIIPHFEKYPLKAKKKRDYEIWKEAVSIMYFGLHKRGKENMKERMKKLNKEIKEVRKFENSNVINSEDIKIEYTE